MAAVSEKTLIAAIKKHLGRDGVKSNIPQIAEDLGGNTTPKDIVFDVWKLEPVAVPRLQFDATKKSIVNARKNDKLRWEQIAARTGESVAKVQEIGGAEAAAQYTGRGRRSGANGGSDGNKAASGRRQAQAASGKGTSGRRAKASEKKDSAKPAGRRARTRAERAAKAGDPK